MKVNDDAAFWNCAALETIASKLAPTTKKKRRLREQPAQSAFF
jgi:hypothetical protein